MNNLDIHAPATHQAAVLHRADLARIEREQGLRPRLAKGGYVTYLPHSERHSNSAPSYPGWGETPEESYANAQYWANQAPFVRTVPASKAPRWAVEACH